MSNYRVRQVLALGDMPARQLRLLVALATWMNDDSRTVRAGFAAVAETMGTSPQTARRARRDAREAKRITYVPGRGRGHVTVWTVPALPEKGVQHADPLLQDRKGGQPGPEKGVNPAEKRGHIPAPDLGTSEQGLDLSAKPLPGAANGAAAPPPGEDPDPAHLAELIDALRREHGWTRSDKWDAS
jgi:hypothetical protein